MEHEIFGMAGVPEGMEPGGEALPGLPFVMLCGILLYIIIPKIILFLPSLLCFSLLPVDVNWLL